MADNDRERWVDDVKRHPEYDGALAFKPGAGWLILRTVWMIMFGLVFTAVSVFLVLVSPAEPGGFRAVWIIGTVIFSLVGVGLVVSGLVRLGKVGLAGTRSVPAMITGKRTRVRRSSGTGSGSTTYYVTVEHEDGDRSEVETRGRLYGAIAEGDAGVAYLRDRYLIDFRRLTGL